MKSKGEIGPMRAAVIVHDLEHARAAAAAARGGAVTLRSAPGAASYLGPLVFRAMIDAARESVPGADVIAVMDCGRDAGRALAALRHGIERVRVDLPLEARMRLADIAGCCNAALDDDESVALDLLDCDDPAAACQKWLADAEK